MGPAAVPQQDTADMPQQDSATEAPIMGEEEQKPAEGMPADGGEEATPAAPETE